MAIKISVTLPSEKRKFLEALITTEKCIFTKKMPGCDSPEYFMSCSECWDKNIKWDIAYPAGYWVCPECSFRNRPECDHCQNCSEDKPHNAEVIT